MSSNTKELRPRVRARSDSPSARPGPTYPRWSKGSVANLSAERIQNMTHAELVQAILTTSAYQLPNDVSARLTLMNRETLERLAFLARKCCRNQGY